MGDDAFLLVSTRLAGRPVLVRASISLALAFLVEISQLYHAPWIDSIRQTTLGGLVLGFGFLWTDLVCYSVGIGTGALTEWGSGAWAGQNWRRFLAVRICYRCVNQTIFGNGDLESSQ